MSELFSFEDKATGYYQDHKSAATRASRLEDSIKATDDRKYRANLYMDAPSDTNQEARAASERKSQVSALTMQKTLAALATSAGARHWRENEAAYHDLAAKEAAKQGVDINTEASATLEQFVDAQDDK